MIIDDILAEDVLPPISSRRNGLVPFPQANSVDCILRIVLNTEEDGSTLLSYLVRNVVNNTRQAQYYINAALYLGLCRKIDKLYYLTGVGKRLQKAMPAKREQMLAAMMLAHPVLSRWYTHIFLCQSAQEKLDLIKTGFADGLAPATADRRCRCVLSWLAWIQKHLAPFDHE